jgi:spermidine synthase
MIMSELIGTAQVPEGVELRLMRRGDDFMIVLDGNELMSTRVWASEEALAEMTCERLGGRSAPDLLIGGYGMGFTLRAALAVLGKDASVTVAELVPEIIAWARGPMRDLTAACLEDPRVVLVEDDVVMLIAGAREGYDAILLDVDNGPDGLTRPANDQLYSPQGLQVAKTALKPAGILAIWSAMPDPHFSRRLREAGFHVAEVGVRQRPNGKGARHVIWFAQKPARIEKAGGRMGLGPFHSALAPLSGSRSSEKDPLRQWFELIEAA